MIQLNLEQRSGKEDGFYKKFKDLKLLSYFVKFKSF